MHTSGPVCPSPYEVLDETCYFMTATTGMMEGTKAMCMNHGAGLAKINTPEKSDTVQALCLDKGGGVCSVWEAAWCSV